MIEKVNIASAPIDEPCVQVSQTEDYLGWMRKECAAFKNQLERMTNAGKFGAPGNAGLMIISQHHDFGMYSEVYVGYSANDAVGEAERKSFISRDRASRQDHVERTRLADEARQADRAAVDQRHAPAPAEHAEPGALRRHAQVAPQRKFEPARHGITLDRGDHRLG